MKKAKFMNEAHLQETPFLVSGNLKKESQDLMKNLPKKDSSFIYGLIGDFGIGKSTILNEMAKLKLDGDYRITFEAWQFPERKELWDGFILHIAAQILLKQHEQIRQKLNNTTETFPILESALELSKEIPAIGTIANILSKVLKSESIPIKRIEEYQQLLQTVLKNHTIGRSFHKGHQVRNTIYIVLEDVDRSGIDGIYFLETLNNFIKNLNEDEVLSRIVCICPIATDSLEANFQKFLKVFDMYDFYHPVLNIESIVRYFFNNKILSDRQESILIDVVSHLIQSSPRHTLREVKFIFRTIYYNYSKNITKLDRFIYLLCQIYKWEKHYDNYFSSDQEKVQAISKGIRKRRIGLNQQLGHDSHATHVDNAIARGIIRYCIESGIVTTSNPVTKIWIKDSPHIYTSQDCLYIPFYYFD